MAVATLRNWFFEGNLEVGFQVIDFSDGGFLRMLILVEQWA